MNRNEAVDWFATEMKAALDEAANRGRSGWSAMGLHVCLRRILEETTELQDSLTDYVHYGDDHEAVIYEAVDVANYCMFLAHNVKKLADDLASERQNKPKSPSGETRC